MKVLAMVVLMGSLAAAAPSQVMLQGVRHEYQRFNNCGPVTLGMALSPWGSELTQYQIAPVLKPNKSDKNVSPHEMVQFARAKGYGVHQGVAGNSGTLKKLLNAGYPVVIETWMELEGEGGMGHYRLVLGYDDEAGVFRSYDSYLGTRVSEPYSRFDRNWQVFNRTYMVFYPQDRASEVEALLAERTNSRWVWKKALQVAQQETESKPGNAYAWFNLGSTLTRLSSPKAASRAFDRARAIGLPFRMLWYQFEPFEAYHKVGKHQQVIELANQVLKNAPDHEEAHFWKGKALAGLGKTTQARAALQQALKHRPGFTEARQALQALV